MKIVYLVNPYSRSSLTFVRREILALERQSWDIHRFALRSVRATLVEPADMAEDARTEHILELGTDKLVVSALGWTPKHPIGAARALGMALQGAGGWRHAGQRGPCAPHYLSQGGGALGKSLP